MSPALPKISIVLPVLNRERMIEKAIRSVLDQRYENLELIIIDGGSQDKTVDVIKRYEKHLAYWHSRPDGGAAVGSNIGIEKATGDLIALLMADDWYERGTLQKIGEAVIAHPSADMVTCGGRLVVYGEKTKTYRCVRTFATARALCLCFFNICFAASAICCRFIRKSLYEEIGKYVPFDATGSPMLSNDKEFLLRAVIHEAKDIFVDHLGYNYLAHKESAGFGEHNKKNIIRLCEEHQDIAESYLKIQNISDKNRLLLRYWYNDQSARLLIYRLLDGNFQLALKVAKDGLKKYHVIWPLAFLCTTSMIITRRGLQLAHQIVNQDCRIVGQDVRF